MSLASNLGVFATRVATEFKSIRTALNGKTDKESNQNGVNRREPIFSYGNMIVGTTDSIVVVTNLPFTGPMGRYRISLSTLTHGHVEGVLSLYHYAPGTIYNPRWTSVGDLPIQVKLAKTAGNKLVLIFRPDSIMDYVRLTIWEAEVGYVLFAEADWQGWTASLMSDWAITSAYTGTIVSATSRAVIQELDGKAPTTHTHDDRYFTETESDARYSLTAHTHAGLAADAVAGTASIRTLGTGAQQAAAGNHTHSGYAPTVHTHTKANITDFAHTHPVGEVTGLGNSATRNVGTTAGTVAAGDDGRLSDWRYPLAHTHVKADFLDFAHSHPIGDLPTDATAPAALGTAAAGSANTLARRDHVHPMPTAAQVGAAATSHTHDDRYYTESETNTLLSGKAASSHTHTKANITDFAHTHIMSDLTDSSAFGRSLLASANNTSARTALDVYSKAETNAKMVPHSMYGEASNSATVNTASVAAGVITDIPGMSVTITGEGRPAKVEFMFPILIFGTGAPAGTIYAWIYQGSTSLQGVAYPGAPNSGVSFPVMGWTITNVLTSGVSYTFKIRASRTGSGSWPMQLVWGANLSVPRMVVTRL